MTKGTIVRKNDKGFGFIKPEEGENDVFFHANDVSGTSFDELNEGDEVTFDMGSSDKGPKAENVEKA